MTADILCLIVMTIGFARAEVACEHMDEVVKASEAYDIRPELMVGLIYAESRWNRKAVSRSNACGLTQVLPKYTRNPKLSCEDLKDPKTSIWTGAKKLNYWIYKYGRGSEKIGLCGYNAGFRCKGENKHKRGMMYSRSVRKYARKILRQHSKMKKNK
tara:strand:+ start:166 stop:636 length:471 start_codon:yes stop_codon:yes gene_type:complete